MAEIIQAPELVRGDRFPMVPGAQVVPPRVLTPLLGRNKDLRHLEDLLNDSDTRLITLMGPAGVGKTRLVLELMSLQQSSYPDGIQYISLATTRDPASVPVVIGLALGLMCPTVAAAKDALQGFLRDRYMLLVLDDVEHLPGASMVWLVDALMASPRLKILVTSRSALNLPGEQRYLLQPFPRPEAGSESVVKQNSAVALFIQRARSVHPDFNPTPEELRAIAEICRQLDGLPLAIELAASRMNILTPVSILEQLSDRFSLLSGGSAVAPVRFHSMQDALIWSHELLSPDERMLFRRLSVFASSFTLDGTRAVAESDEDSGCRESLMNLMSSLVDQSMVMQMPVPSDQPRFTMLETIREFAALQLAASGETAAIRNGHAAWCLQLVHELRLCWGTAAQSDVIGRYELERDNLQTALSWLVDSGSQRELAQLASELFMFWCERHPVIDGHSCLDAALNMETGDCPVERMRLLAAADTLSRALSETHFTKNAEPTVPSSSATIELAVNEPPVQSLAIITPIHPVSQKVSASMVLPAAVAPACRIDPGMRLTMESQPASNVEHLNRLRRLVERSLNVRGVPDFIWGVIESLNLFGDCAEREGRADAASSLYRASLSLSLGEADFWQVVFPIERLAIQAVRAGDTERAVRLFGKIHQVHEEAGQPDSTVAGDGLQRAIDDAHRHLGDERFVSLWSEGRTLSMDELINEARQSNLNVGAPNAGHAPLSISPREMDVLRLINAHLTDQQIANTLFISRRTVNTHVSHLLNKLNASSRRDAILRAKALGLLAPSIEAAQYT